MLTPCVGICRLKEKVCIGCGRTVVEITNWSRYTDEVRLEIYNRLTNNNKGSVDGKHEE